MNIHLHYLTNPNYSRLFELEHVNFIPSLNAWARMHHYKRHKLEKKIKKKIKLLLAPLSVYKIEEFEVVLLVNTRSDVDNNLLIIKFFVDTLKEMSIINNDDRKYFKCLFIGNDKSLKNNHFFISILGNARVFKKNNWDPGLLL